MKVQFLATHFRNQAEVLSFLKMLADTRRPKDCEISVLIADNSGDWRKPEHSLPNWVRVYSPDENLGYLNGCDWVLRQLDQIDSDYVIVTNTDIVLHQSFLEKLSELRPSNNVGLIAPAVHLTDGTPQNPYMISRPSYAKMKFYSWVFRSTWGLRLLDFAATLSSYASRRRSKSRNSHQSGGHNQHSVIYAAHGSIFALCPAFFAKGASLQYGAFMYGEEIHIAEQARRLDLQTLLVPELAVEHRAHAVTGRTDASDKTRHKYQSIRFIIDSYYSKNSL